MRMCVHIRMCSSTCMLAHVHMHEHIHIHMRVRLQTCACAWAFAGIHATCWTSWMSICIMHTDNPSQGRASGTTGGAGLIAPAVSTTVVEAGSADIGCSGEPPCDGREVIVTI